MLKQNPWEGYVKPGRMFGNLYFVGTKPSSTHIIDTGDGLILIDPGHLENFYLVVNNIWELGFNPKDIKIILLSHCHFDHTDATERLVNMCGAKVYLGKDDMPLWKGDIYHYDFTPFRVDEFMSDGDVIELGNTKIECISTPGHTDGTMSFLFDVTDGKNTYKACMFGGAGINTMTKEFIEKNNLTYDHRQKFLDSIERLKKLPVDINIGNHVGGNNTVENLKALEENPENNPFVNPQQWKDFLKERKERILEIIAKN